MPLVRDLSTRARMFLSGPDRVRFLHGMVTNDIEALAPGGGCRAAMLTVKGKLLADLIVYADEDRLLLELDGELRDKIAGVIAQPPHHGRRRVRRRHRRDAGAGRLRRRRAGGDRARARRRSGRAGSLSRTASSVACASRRRPSLACRRLSRLRRREASNGEPLSDEELRSFAHRGRPPRYGVDMDEDRLVLEAGVDDAVSLTKGCYLGQEVVARATARGHINRKLRRAVSRRRTPGRARRETVRTRPRGRGR